MISNFINETAKHKRDEFKEELMFIKKKIITKWLKNQWEKFVEIV